MHFTFRKGRGGFRNTEKYNEGFGVYIVMSNTISSTLYHSQEWYKAVEALLILRIQWANLIPAQMHNLHELSAITATEVKFRKFDEFRRVQWFVHRAVPISDIFLRINHHHEKRPFSHSARMHLTNGHWILRIIARHTSTNCAIFASEKNSNGFLFGIVNYAIRLKFSFDGCCHLWSPLVFPTAGRRRKNRHFSTQREIGRKNRISILVIGLICPFFRALHCQMALCNVKLCLVAQTFISISLR